MDLQLLRQHALSHIEDNFNEETNSQRFGHFLLGLLERQVKERY